MRMAPQQATLWNKTHTAFADVEDALFKPIAQGKFFVSWWEGATIKLLISIVRTKDLFEVNL